MNDKRMGFRASLVKIVLYVLSLGYLILVEFIKFLYSHNMLKTTKLGVKVISIGNITLGGTGKTPATMAVAGMLKKMNKNPGVLIRGYGEDEKYLLKNKLKEIPVFAGRDRARLGKSALEDFELDALILDDGFQHWRLKRDIDIVVIDGLNPFGNNEVLPRGILREPVRALKRADVFLITKVDMCKDETGLKRFLSSVNGDAVMATSLHRPVSLIALTGNEKNGLSYLKNKKIAVLSSIGDPVYFKNIVANLGADVKSELVYCDHYDYRQTDVEDIFKKSYGLDAIITTEKDVVKLSRLDVKNRKPEILALEIELNIKDGEQMLLNKLQELFAKKPASGARALNR